MSIENPQQVDLFDDLVDSFDVDQELALQFFLVFAWLENLLKYMEYWEYRGYVKIKWMNFGREMDEYFDPNRTQELKTAYQFLIDEAPRREEPDGDDIVWNGIEERENATDLEKVLYLVNTVRNNLFHGGKFPRFRERDAKLLKACLVILKECIELHPELKEYYRVQVEGNFDQ